MHFFSLKTLFYYLLHSAGFFFTMTSIFGIPRQIDDTNLKLKKIIVIYNILLNVAWIGIFGAFLGSILAFIYDWKTVWNTFAFISLILGLSTFFCMLILHRIK